MSQQTSLFSADSDQKDFDTFDPFTTSNPSQQAQPGSSNISQQKKQTDGDPFSNWETENNPFNDNNINNNNNNNINPFENIFENTSNKDKQPRRHSQPHIITNNNNINNNFDTIPQQRHVRATSVVIDNNINIKNNLNNNGVGSNTVVNPNQSNIHFRQSSIASQGSNISFNFDKQESIEIKEEENDIEYDDLYKLKENGYELKIFEQENIANKYKCIICELICQNPVEIDCQKKKHISCIKCIKKYIKNHGNKCPIHPEINNIDYKTSKYIHYHLNQLKIKCPNNFTSLKCKWTGLLKELSDHITKDFKYTKCPFGKYGCDKDEIERNKLDNHLNKFHHKHMSLLLKQVNKLTNKLDKSNDEIKSLKKELKSKNNDLKTKNEYNRVAYNNLFMLCGSHKFWKHKYNQLYTVNVSNNARTNIRITDISKSNKNTNDINVLPTQSDWWDVGDLAVTLLLNKYKIPNWLMKKYSTLNPFITSQYDSIIFRSGGHLIRDKKVTNRVDAILFNTHNNMTATMHGYHIDCFPNLPTKRYNCESVYSDINGLIVVGGSGVDKQQINKVDQLKLSDNNLNTTQNEYNTKDSVSTSTSLLWKSLSPLITAREDTALCLFKDKNNINKEYMIVCGGWSNGCLKKCELYNFNLNKWINMKPMYLKHNAAGICEWKYNDSILICGGFNTEAHYACEYFDLIKQKWNKLPNMNYKHRYKPATWIDNNNPQIICCAGNGVLKKEVGYVEYLDTRDTKWQVLQTPLSNLLALGDQINPNNWRMWRIFHPTM